MTALLEQVGPVVVPPPPPDLREPPGDAAAATAAARRCLAAAQALHDNQSRLTEHAGSLLARRLWCGAASAAFQRSRTEAAAWLGNAGRALALVATALVTYAQALEQAQGLARGAATRADDLRQQRSRLLAEIEQARSSDPAPGLLFGTAAFTPATVALQHRADLLADDIAAVAAAVETAQALTRRAEQTAASAFDEATSMTFAARERAALRRAGRSSDSSAGTWLDVGELVGLGLIDLALGVADVAQGGLDPVTDAAELAAVSRTGTVASRLGARFLADDTVATAAAEATRLAEGEALAAVEAETGGGWLAAARAKLPDGWGPGTPASKGNGFRWIEPEGQGSYLRIDPGRPGHPDVLQRVDHVHVRQGFSRIGRGGQRLSDRTADLTDAELDELARLEHVPLSEWLTWKNWWQR